MAATGLDHLTENDIDEILSRLSTRDAVRTSVLSRSWRHRWKSIPDLDLSFIPIAAADKTLLLHSAPVRHIKFQTSNSETIVPLFDAIVRRSSISLRSIDISSASTFQLSSFAQFFHRLTLIKLSDCVIQKLHGTPIFPDLQTLDITNVVPYDITGLERTGYLTASMYIPAACPKLEKLTLQLRCYPDTFRCDLGTISRDFPRLTHLKLSGCHLNIVQSALATPIFHSLRTLHITNFEALEDDDYDVAMDSTVYFSIPTYIPACPKLEKLTLDMEDGADDRIGCYIDTISRNFPRLTHLELKGCHLNIVPSALDSLLVLHLSDVDVDGKLSVLFSSCPSLETLILISVKLVAETHLHVSAPNLRFLELADPKVHDDYYGYCLPDFSITNSPVLETVLLDLLFDGGDDEEADESCNLMKVLGNLPSIKKLTLHNEAIEFLQRGLVPEKLPASFEHLTHLSVDLDSTHIDEASVVLFLLRRAPNLQEVECRLRSGWNGFMQSGWNGFIESPGDREIFWKELEHMDAFDNLRTVRWNLIGE